MNLCTYQALASLDLNILDYFEEVILHLMILARAFYTVCLMFTVHYKILNVFPDHSFSFIIHN